MILLNTGYINQMMIVRNLLFSVLCGLPLSASALPKILILNATNTNERDVKTTWEWLEEAKIIQGRISKTDVVNISCTSNAIYLTTVDGDKATKMINELITISFDKDYSFHSVDGKYVHFKLESSINEFFDDLEHAYQIYNQKFSKVGAFKQYGVNCAGVYFD
ncbi:TPA: hypothetical protein I7304_20505 [Vibrio vulnificus]|uniref:hypothetical protein n=1 Tax=Vibrio vulnificus TaxID=672 RepID=UPI0005779CE0|nr:hypothetical protein [Vibrio vulnificus]HAS6938419.1 hypothetical protein [Vibrio vulnificus]